MNGSTYAIAAYVLGIGLLWGYVATVWFSIRGANVNGKKDGVS